MMNASDEAVEKVLHAIGNADAPQGMERRILEKLDAHAEQKQWTWQPVLLSFVCLMALVALSVALVKMPRAQHAPESAHVSPVRVPVVPRSAPWMGEGHSAAQVTTRRARVRRPAVMDASHLPSFPAPPLPLTQEEQSLVRVVRQGDPGIRDLLNADKQETQLAKETDQFEDFFGKKIKRDKQ